MRNLRYRLLYSLHNFVKIQKLLCKRNLKIISLLLHGSRSSFQRERNLLCYYSSWERTQRIEIPFWVCILLWHWNTTNKENSSQVKVTKRIEYKEFYVPTLFNLRYSKWGIVHSRFSYMLRDGGHSEAALCLLQYITSPLDAVNFHTLNLYRDIIKLTKKSVRPNKDSCQEMIL